MQIKSFAGYSGDSNLCKNNRKWLFSRKRLFRFLAVWIRGWLLGALGQRQRTIIETQNRNYWICNDCGYKFRNTEDWHEEIKKKEQAVKVNLVLTIFFIIVAMLLFTGGEVSSVVGIVFLIIGAVNAITFFLGKTRIRNELQHLDDLESSSME